MQVPLGDACVRQRADGQRLRPHVHKPGDVEDAQQPPGAGEEDRTASPAAHPAGNLRISEHSPRLPKSRAVSYKRCINQVRCLHASSVLQTVTASGRRCVGDAGAAPHGTDTRAFLRQRTSSGRPRVLRRRSRLQSLICGRVGPAPPLAPGRAAGVATT